MKKIIPALSTFIILSIGLLGFAETIAPDHSAITYTGRFTDDYTFSWTGSQIETVLKGESISAHLELVDGNQAGITIVVDDKESFLKLQRGQTVYELASGLDPDQPHHIVVFKRSEGFLGAVRFGGFEVPDGSKLLPAPDRKHKLLVIGDSITCGYGNEAKEISEGNTVENENGYQSYAPVAARLLDADVMMVCWSGRGMHRNRSLQNDKDGVLPQLFEQTLAQQAEPKWDHSRFVPEVIAINLGTNDESTRNGDKEPLKEEDFAKSYSDFITRLREVAPDAHIILTIGPMTIAPLDGWLPKIAEQFDNTSVLVYEGFMGRTEQIGGHWHPSVLKDKLMGETLAEHIRSVTDWK